jgi:hypothetical protein
MIAVSTIEMPILPQEVTGRYDGVSAPLGKPTQKFSDMIQNASRESSEPKNSKEIISKVSAREKVSAQTACALGATTDQSALVPPFSIPLPLTIAENSQSADQGNGSDTTSTTGSISIGTPLVSQVVLTPIYLPTAVNVARLVSRAALIAGESTGTESDVGATNGAKSVSLLSLNSASSVDPDIGMRAMAGDRISRTDDAASPIKAIQFGPTTQEITSSAAKSAATDTPDINLIKGVLQSLVGPAAKRSTGPTMNSGPTSHAEPGLNAKSDAVTNPVVGQTTQGGQLAGELTAANISAEVIVNPGGIAKGKAALGISAKDGTKASGQVTSSSAVADPKLRSASVGSSINSQAKDEDATKPEGSSQGNKMGDDQTIVAIPVASVERVGSQDVHAETVVISPTMTQQTPTRRDAASHVPEAAVRAQSATASAPTALPAINTAKVIQSMGQTEMRVGMNSAEFGNISIRTSTTRDAIVAQISLDHGDLAKELAVHLPEIQQKLSSNIPVSVRIDLTGSPTGQTSGNYGGTSNGTANNSGGHTEQRQNDSERSFGGNVLSWGLSQVAATVVPSGGIHNARLDIRI